jgi:hypothetical protein
MLLLLLWFFAFGSTAFPATGLSDLFGLSQFDLTLATLSMASYAASCILAIRLAVV